MYNWLFIYVLKDEVKDEKFNLPWRKKMCVYGKTGNPFYLKNKLIIILAKSSFIFKKYI